MISVIRRWVSCSRPFTRLTTGAHGRRYGASSVSTSRDRWDGTAMLITSVGSTAACRSCVATSDSGSGKSGKYLLLVCVSLMSAVTSSERAQITVGDLRATIDATAVPQDPAPITATFG